MFHFWREVVSREIVHVEIEPLLDAPLDSKVSLRALPGLRSIENESVPALVQRTREFVASGDDSFALLINLSGAAMFSQRRARGIAQHRRGRSDSARRPGILSHSQIHVMGLCQGLSSGSQSNLADD